MYCLNCGLWIGEKAGYCVSCEPTVFIPSVETTVKTSAGGSRLGWLAGLILIGLIAAAVGLRSVVFETSETVSNGKIPPSENLPANPPVKLPANPPAKNTIYKVFWCPNLNL